jgi:magnesium transporter
MIIRGLALDEIENKDVFRVWWKEIRVAGMVGLTLSLVNFLRIVIQYHANPNNVRIAATVSLTLIATVLIAKSLGCLLPMLSRKLRLDPAVAAAPMLTTITDACSILVFFNIAITLLGQLM